MYDFLAIKPYNYISNLNANQLKNLAKKSNLDLPKIENFEFTGILCTKPDTDSYEDYFLQAVYKINGQDYYINFSYIGRNDWIRHIKSGRPTAISATKPANAKYQFFVSKETLEKISSIDSVKAFEMVRAKGADWYPIAGPKNDGKKHRYPAYEWDLSQHIDITDRSKYLMIPVGFGFVVQEPDHIDVEYDNIYLQYPDTCNPTHGYPFTFDLDGNFKSLYIPVIPG